MEKTSSYLPEQGFFMLQGLERILHGFAFILHGFFEHGLPLMLHGFAEHGFMAGFPPLVLARMYDAMAVIFMEFHERALPFIGFRTQ